MSKKNRKGKGSKTKSGYGVSPEFKRRIEETHENALDLSDAPDELRLSDRILRLIDPYMEMMDILPLVDCATIAWNECLDEDFGIKGAYSLNNVLLNFSKQRELIDALKSRKRLLFKNNRRHIKEVKVYDKGDDMSINVASDFDIGDAFAGLAEMATDEEDDVALDTYEDDGDISKPNPRLKHMLLEVVDNQLRDNDPPITRETFERLQSTGDTPKQAKEKIAAVIIEDIYNIMTTQKPHDEAEYERRLKSLK